VKASAGAGLLLPPTKSGNPTGWERGFISTKVRVTQKARMGSAIDADPGYSVASYLATADPASGGS
jgi:hypothetical protein